MLTKNNFSEFISSFCWLRISGPHMDAMKQKQNINDASETRHQSVVDCFHQTMNDQDPNKVLSPSVRVVYCSLCFIPPTPAHLNCPAQWPSKYAAPAPDLLCSHKLESGINRRHFTMGKVLETENILLICSQFSLTS